MTSVDIRDLVIIIPGILGSCLSKHGKMIWQPARTVAELQWKREKLLAELQLHGDDHTVDDLGDGVVATDLVSDVEIIPGLVRVDGYNRLWKRLRDALQLRAGNVFTPDPNANLYVFPYDWRRDNRVAARRLEAFVAAQLCAWRASSGAADAQVIFVTHSMGGLVARYYLELLGGWEHCRGLFTLGTPHRGSWAALDYLMNGYKILSVDMRPAMNTFTSVYQLLPTYGGVDSGSSTATVVDTLDLPGDLRSRAAEAARTFHDPITTAARRRRSEGRSPANSIFPTVGIYQKTLQGGWMTDKLFVPKPDLPSALLDAGVPTDGDKTVPAFSAIPQEYKDILDGPTLAVVESHSSLQTNEYVINDIIWKIQALQSRGGWNRLAPGYEVRMQQPALRLHLDDVYSTQGGEIRVEVLDSDDPGSLQATVEPLDPEQSEFVLPFTPRETDWIAELGTRPAGIYRIRVEPFRLKGSVARPIHDLFEITTT